MYTCGCVHQVARFLLLCEMVVFWAQAWKPQRMSGGALFYRSLFHSSTVSVSSLVHSSTVRGHEIACFPRNSYEISAWGRMLLS